MFKSLARLDQANIPLRDLTVPDLTVRDATVNDAPNGWKGGFHPQAVIWVIRLTSPHLP